MRSGVERRSCGRMLLVAAICVAGAGCGGAAVFAPEYEYEEELYLSLDGSAIVNVNASVASLVALRGAKLDPDPRARIDRDYLRRFFGAPDTDVSLSLSRRDGRRFVHAAVEVDNVRELSRLEPFAWSDYQLDRGSDVVEFRQKVGPPARDSSRPSTTWTGGELVAFRAHLPSEVIFHNAPSGRTERGNILVWEQPLAERLAARPVEIHVQLEPTSILTTTLLLFGSTVVAAIAALAGVVWWISRRRRDSSQLPSIPTPKTNS